MYEVLIYDLDNLGRGITKINNKIVFVANTLPGDKCIIKITKEKKNFDEAEVIEVIDSSKDRIKSQCIYSKECGGCDFIDYDYKKQLEYKQKKVQDLIQKIGKIDKQVNDIIECDSNLNYRNKITLQIDNKIGYYKKKSYDVVDIDYCMIANSKINEIIKLSKKFEDIKKYKSLMIRSFEETNETMIVFEINKYENIEKIKEYYKDNVDSIYIKRNNEYVFIYGKDKIFQILKEKKYLVSPESFFQVNTYQSIKLYDKVKSYIENSDKNILDLYCGTGSIGIYIAKGDKKVLGIELNKTAVKDADENKRINNNKNIQFMCGDSKDILKKINFKFDVVIVDPPRSGLTKDTIDEIKKINSKKIIYVSCDPATLARDLNLLSDNYDIKEITPLDMFPNTYHVETIVLMTKK